MAARQTRRQLQFSTFEMVLIAVSFLVSITAVFFLGLFVGRKNASMHAAAETRVARVPVDDFTRYRRPAPVPAPQREAAPAAAPAAPSGAPAAAGASPVAKPAAEAKPPAEAAPAKAPAEAAAKPAEAAAKPADAAAKAAADAAAAKATADAAAKAAREKEQKEKELKEKEEEASTGRGYTVQLLATRKQSEADALVQKLKARGYAAYIRKVNDGAGAWYRVRVGSYGAFSEARAMADRCRRELSLGQAFVSTE